MGNYRQSQQASKAHHMLQQEEVAQPKYNMTVVSPSEEGNRLNQLIEEYRRENDRCSKRINEL